MIPFLRIRVMIASRSGWSNGSPPLIVMMAVPMVPSRSMRRNISLVGTGFEKSSNSLQYVQERLQRRVGMICTSSGCRIERSPFASMRASRSLRCAARNVLRALRRNVTSLLNGRLHGRCLIMPDSPLKLKQRPQVYAQTGADNLELHVGRAFFHTHPHVSTGIFRVV